MIDRNPPEAAEDLDIVFDPNTDQYILYNVKTKTLMGDLPCLGPKKQGKYIAWLGHQMFRFGYRRAQRDMRAALGITGEQTI
jgi:hypothetical protein